jgi:hypothetical protein
VGYKDSGEITSFTLKGYWKLCEQREEKPVDCHSVDSFEITYKLSDEINTNTPEKIAQSKYTE